MPATLTETDENQPQRGIRLLNICETAQGGVGVYQTYLAGLAAHGFDVATLAPRQHAATLAGAAGLRLYDRTGRNLPSLWRLVVAGLRARRAFRPDVVFFHSTFALLPLAAMRLTGYRGPALYCAHGWAAGGVGSNRGIRSRLVRLVEGRLAGLADLVVNVSGNDAALAMRHGYRGRPVVVENAVPDARADAAQDLFAAEPEATHLLFVGRFDRQKGLDLLLAGFDRARVRRPDLRLHIVGAAVRADGAAIDLPQGASLSGWVESARIDDWYRSADAVVVPSRWEGLPLVIPEALRNGTPVLCSDRSGMGGLIGDGTTGHVFALEDDSLERLLTGLDSARLRAMRPAARALYDRRFRVERMLGELAALIRGLAR